MKLIDEFEGGRLFRVGRIPLLDLHGTYHAMGRQYGYLLKDQLHTLYRTAVEDHFIGAQNIPYERLKRIGIDIFDLYPRRFKMMIYGMAETSGMSVGKHIILNGLEFYGLLFGCSGIAVWDEFTDGGSLIFGRNYDWYSYYRDFASCLTVTVLHPGSSYASAIITFAGVIYATTGINECGLFLELNNGMPVSGDSNYSNRVPIIIKLLTFLQDHGTMEQLDAALNSTRANYAYIINVADCDGAYSYECPTYDIRRLTGDPRGLLVATNHFVHHSWGTARERDTNFKTITRRENLIRHARQNIGKFSLSKMKELLDLSLLQGGATWPPGERIQTVYQVIAVPEDLTIWLKIPAVQEWSEIPLAFVFPKK